MTDLGQVLATGNGWPKVQSLPAELAGAVSGQPGTDSKLAALCVIVGIEMPRFGPNVMQLTNVTFSKNTSANFKRKLHSFDLI